MKVLSKSELKTLLSICTTKKEAARIKKKFTAIKDLVESGEGGGVNIECPHCGITASSAFACRDCRYTEALGLSGAKAITCCIHVPFGGVKYSPDVSRFIDLDERHAWVHSSWSMAPEVRQKAIRWAQGHIEWAEAILAKKGSR